MNIHKKTLMVMGCALILSALGNFLVLRHLVFPTFVTLEEDAALRDMLRASEGINTEIDNLSVTLWDYANWDDSYRFVSGKLPTFPEVNLNADNLSKFQVDLVEAYGLDRGLRFKGIIDEDEHSEIEWSFSSLDAGGHLFDFPEEKLSVKGLLSTPDGLLMVASRPVFKTSGEGPSAGIFIFGRFLDDEAVAEIKRKTKIEFELLAVEQVASDRGNDLIARLLETESPIVLEDPNSDRLTTLVLMRDYVGAPIRVLKSQIGRDITASGRRVVLASMAGIAVTGLIVMAALALILQWLLIGPLVKLTQQIVAIGRKGNLVQRVALTRGDEIGVLSREFDRMLDRLTEARDRLLERSFHSGLAEMAAGVLHNLRNHLTPLSMRVGRLYHDVERASRSKLGLAFNELTGEAVDAERRVKLLTYVDLALREEARHHSDALEQLNYVAQELHQINDALQEIDRFGRADNRLEAITLSHVVDDTIALLPIFPDLRVDMVVDPALDEGLRVMSTPFILKHVLHNLFVNAFEAIRAAGKTSGRIDLAYTIEAVEGRNVVDLQIRDDGIGIPPDHREAIFMSGFTTKIGERRGTGLHWCANSMNAMGGKLFARSPGLNQGATLHVILPLAEGRVTTAVAVS